MADVRPAHLAQAAIVIRDQDRAKSFYRDKLGLRHLFDAPPRPFVLPMRQDATDAEPRGSPGNRRQFNPLLRRGRCGRSAANARSRGCDIQKKKHGTVRPPAERTSG